MIPYIGDISIQDAIVLRDFAQHSESVLEFGVGASTQVIAKYTGGEFTSIETNVTWIEKTIKNLDLLKIDKKVWFFLYGDFMSQEHTQKYDLIFNDGVDHLRRQFGLYAFDKLLKPNGILLFHDQRRTGDVYNMCEVIRDFSAYIDLVQINYQGSNITVIHKRDKPLFYENWNEIEGRTDWQMGQGDISEEEIEKLRAL